MSKLTTAERIMAAREGGWVERVHTCVKTRPYRVDSHSWAVALLAWELFPQSCTNEFIMACLMHDIPERWVGDSPYPAKYPLTRGRLGALLHKAEAPIVEALHLEKPMTDRERQILSFCDLLEFVLWAREEANLGNKIMKAKFEAGMGALMETPLWAEQGETVLDMLAVPSSEECDWWKDMLNV